MADLDSLMLGPELLCSLVIEDEILERNLTHLQRRIWFQSTGHTVLCSNPHGLVKLQIRWIQVLNPSP